MRIVLTTILVALIARCQTAQGSAKDTAAAQTKASQKDARKPIRVVESGSGLVGVNPDQPYRPIPLNRTQPRQTIFEFYLRALNPRQIRWGDVIDQRLAQLSAQSIENPYFRMCALQLALVLALMLVCWLWWDKLQQVKWIAAECLADAINAKLIADQHAFEAIGQYNRHIESCNRVIESGEIGGTVHVNKWKEELLESQRELAQSKSEVARLRGELTRRDEMMTSLSSRVADMEALIEKKANENAATVARLQRAETQLGSNTPAGRSKS
jgi:hypothetical protein